MIGEVAGRQPFAGTIGAGEAVRIFTGGAVPDGADAIVIQEDATRDGDASSSTRPRAPAATSARPASISRRATAAEGRVASIDRDLALAAADGPSDAAGARRPRVALVATGDELVLPGSDAGRPDRLFQRLRAARADARRGRRRIDLGIVPRRWTRPSPRSAARATPRPTCW